MAVGLEESTVIAIGARGDLQLPHTGLTTAQDLLASAAKGLITERSVPGGRRAGRAESLWGRCLLPPALTPASVWSPAGQMLQLSQAAKVPRDTSEASSVGEGGSKIRGTMELARHISLLQAGEFPAQPQVLVLQHSTGQPCTHCCMAHLGTAALHPTLSLPCLQHLKKAWECSETDGTHPQAGTAPQQLGGCQGHTQHLMKRMEHPRSPRYLLHGSGHSRGTEFLLCHPAGWG